LRRHLAPCDTPDAELLWPSLSNGQKMSKAANTGRYVETVRSALENDRLVDVVLRRDSAPSLFDFDVPQK